MNTVLKYPGSKWSTAEWIISMFPADYENMTYLEPFFGSGAVFFNKKRSKIETINDIDIGNNTERGYFVVQRKLEKVGGVE